MSNQQNDKIKGYEDAVKQTVERFFVLFTREATHYNKTLNGTSALITALSNAFSCCFAALINDVAKSDELKGHMANQIMDQTAEILRGKIAEFEKNEQDKSVVIFAATNSEDTHHV